MKTNALSLRIQDYLNATGLLTLEGLEPTAQSFTSGSEVNQVTFKMVLEPIKMLLEKFRSNNRIVNEQSCVKLFKTLLLIVKSYRLSISSARELLFLNKFVQKDDNRFVSCSDEVIVLYLKIMSQLFKKYDLLCHVSCFTFILTLNTLFKTKSMEILRYSLKLLHVLFGKHHRPISFESFINYKEILDRIFPGIATSLFQKLCLEEKRSLIRIKILEVLADLIVYFIGDHLPDKYSKDSAVDISSPYTNSNRVSFIIKTIINECSLSGSQDIKTTCSVFTSRIMINCYESLKNHAPDILNQIFILDSQRKGKYLELTREYDHLFSVPQVVSHIQNVVNGLKRKNTWDFNDLTLFMIVLRHRSKIKPDFTINHIVFNQIVKLTKLEVIQHFERSEMRASVLEFVPSDLDIFLVFYEHIKFKKINSYDDYRTMIEFCGMYGLVMGLENHIDELLFLHSEGQAQAIQSLLIIRMFLSHSSEISFGEFDNIYIQIMKFLVKQSVLSNQNTFFGYSDFEFGVLNELNIFDELKNDRDSGTTMIILQTLDLLALLCPLLSEKSRIYQPLILYDVLSLVADHCLMIRMYAARTLQNISLSLQYDNVKELINSNLDYLVDSAYTSLTCHYYQCNAVTILRVLIEFFPSDTLLSVLVLDSMRFMLKISHEFREASLCFAINTFKSYTTAVIKFYKVEESNKPDITYPELDLNQSVWEYFTKLDEDTSYEPLESNEAEIKKLPQFELVKDIVEVISHYITSHSNILSISVIQTCQLGLSALSNFESDRLPLIHKVWVPIMFHVQNSNVRILPSVMSIVGSLANHSKDFIRDRLSKELLPQILSKVSDHDNVKKRLLLISNKSICYHDDSILAILRLLKDVVARVEMRESDLLRIYEISQRIGCTSSPEAKLVASKLTNILQNDHD